MNRIIIALSFVLIMSCATAKKLAPPTSPTYQSNAIGKAHTGLIPPEFLKNHSKEMMNQEQVKPPSDRQKTPETVISLKALDTQNEGDQKISLALRGATIEQVVLAMREVSRNNFLIDPSAKNVVTSDVTLKEVEWLKALVIITQASGLVASLNGNGLLRTEEDISAIMENDVIVISTFDSFIARNEEKIKAAKLAQSIVEKRRSALQELSVITSIRDNTQRTSRSYRLKYADPSEVKKYLENLYNGTGSRAKSSASGENNRAKDTTFSGNNVKGRRNVAGANRFTEDRINISIFKAENMITVTAPERRLDEINARIEEIDIAPRQVYIVSRIVEIQRNHIRELGIQWGGQMTRVTNNAFPQTVGVFGGGQSANGQDSAVSLAPPGSIDPATGQPLANPTGAVFGMTLGSVSGTTLLHAKLFALEQAGLSRTLSNPKVTAINGSKAVIKSGKEIPYQSTSANLGTTVRFKEAVISLSVTPLIIADDRIRMSIEAKKDEVDTALSIQGAPAIKKKELTTSVIVQNGGSAALGGIFVGEEGDFEERVPWFHKIPFLGSLFKNKRRINNQLELLIFITPTIIE